MGNVAIATLPSWTDIPIPNNLDNAVSMTISGTNIEFTATKAGKYLIDVDFSAEVNGNGRTVVAMRLLSKPAAGTYAALSGTERLAYIRGSTNATSVSCSYLLTMAIGDSIKLQAGKRGDDMDTYTGGTSFRMQRLV